MSKPTEDDLRRAKDNLRSVVSDQQRKLGVPDPGGREVDAFIAPILEKVARTEHVSDEEKTLPQPARDPLEGVTAVELGSYDWNLTTNEFAARPGSYVPTPEDRLRVFIRFLLYQPEVNAAMLRVGRICDRHTKLRAGCFLCERREVQFRELLRRCAVKYQYGRQKPAPKIVSVGR